MKRVLIALMISAMGFASLPSSALPTFMNRDCLSSNLGKSVKLVNKTPKYANATTDAVSSSRIDVYTLKFTGPDDHYVTVQPTTGDTDVVVCKSSLQKKGKKWVTVWKESCRAVNIPLLPDACVFEDEDLNAVNPGVGKPLKGAGTYKLFILHCTSIPSCTDLPKEVQKEAGKQPLNYVAAWA